MDKLVGWSEERIKMIVELAKTGMSRLEIANRIGGTTRSAVIGKLNRLGVGESGPADDGARAPKGRWCPS